MIEARQIDVGGGIVVKLMARKLGAEYAPAWEHRTSPRKGLEETCGWIEIGRSQG